MMNFFRGTMVFSAMAGALVLSAQTPAPEPAQSPAPAAAPAAAATPALAPDEVVSKYVDAIGGKDAVSQVKSITMDTDVQVMGNDAPGTVKIVDGVGYRQDTDFNGSTITQCYNDKSGWQVNPMAGAADPTAMSDDEYKAGKDQIFIGGPLYNYAAKGSKVESMPGDPGTYKVKLTTKDNTDMTYVFDAKTFLIKSMTRKGQMQGQDVDITTSYSDWRKTDAGYLLPYEMDVDLGGQFQLNIAVKKVDLNKTIDPAVFEMPKPAATQPAAPANQPSL